MKGMNTSNQQKLGKLITYDSKDIFNAVFFFTFFLLNKKHKYRK